MSLAPKTIRLRPMTASDADLDGGLRLSTSVQWPYRREDWAIALELGLGAAAEMDGILVGSALWWPYGPAFATCGIVIVSPDAQGRGIGRMLMDSAMAGCGERAIMLNATNEGLRLYEGLGFVAVGTVHQHQALVPPEAATAPPLEGEALVEVATPADMPTIRRLDAAAFGAGRDRLIDAFDRIGSMLVLRRGGAIDGFALCRHFGRGRSVGPVVARDAADAQALIRAFARRHAGTFLRIDIPGDSGLGDWLAAEGLPEVGSVTTMIRGGRPATPGPFRHFGLASQSFG